jgi:hypothetical protein
MNFTTGDESVLLVKRHIASITSNDRNLSLLGVLTVWRIASNDRNDVTRKQHRTLHPFDWLIVSSSLLPIALTSLYQSLIHIGARQSGAELSSRLSLPGTVHSPFHPSKATFKTTIEEICDNTQL